MVEENRERLLIREELAEMSFEELAKLKEELGRQVYNEAVFGVKKKPFIAKRANHNRPREMSAKIRVPIAPNMPSPATSKFTVRDPRFDRLCGEFQEPIFKKNYSFIDKIKQKEKEELKEELKKEQNKMKKKEIKFLITRMENQEREAKKKEQKNEEKRKEFTNHIKLLKEGKKPQFVKKSDKRVLNLVSKFETLKKSGKVLKEIEKFRKKKTKKEKKKIPFTRD